MLRKDRIPSGASILRSSVAAVSRKPEIAKPAQLLPVLRLPYRKTRVPLLHVNAAWQAMQEPKVGSVGGIELRQLPDSDPGFL